MMGYRVCPECGSKSLSLLATNMIVMDCFDNCKTDGVDVDFDLFGDADFEDTQETVRVYTCPECGYKYTSETTYEVIMEEMIPEEDYEEKQDGSDTSSRPS
jgi:DNA-directed RNA polymerase subunit RPC12/RpoP